MFDVGIANSRDFLARVMARHAWVATPLVCDPHCYDLQPPRHDPQLTTRCTSSCGLGLYKLNTTHTPGVWRGAQAGMFRLGRNVLALTETSRPTRLS